MKTLCVTKITFKTIAFLNALSHIVHWWLLSPWTLRIWLPNECLFCKTLLQIGQLANVSWCRFRCFRRLSSCFNLLINTFYCKYIRFDIQFSPSTTNITLHLWSGYCRMFLHMILKNMFAFEYTSTYVADVSECEFMNSSNVWCQDGFWYETGRNI